MLVKALIIQGFLIGLLALGGCCGTTSMGDHFVMSGTPEGIRAFGDTLNGALKTAKEKPEARNQYFAARRDYEQNVTARELHKPRSFIRKLFDQDETRDVTDANTAAPEGQGS